MVSGWLQGLGPQLALALLVVSAFWHARLGLQVLIGGYVSDPGRRLGSIIVLNLATSRGAAVGLLCQAHPQAARALVSSSRAPISPSLSWAARRPAS
jgi:hypothetical protein